VLYNLKYYLFSFGITIYKYIKIKYGIKALSKSYIRPIHLSFFRPQFN